MTLHAIYFLLPTRLGEPTLCVSGAVKHYTFQFSGVERNCRTRRDANDKRGSYTRVAIDVFTWVQKKKKNSIIINMEKSCKFHVLFLYKTLVR